MLSNGEELNDKHWEKAKNMVFNYWNQQQVVSITGQITLDKLNEFKKILEENKIKSILEINKQILVPKFQTVFFEQENLLRKVHFI